VGQLAICEWWLEHNVAFARGTRGGFSTLAIASSGAELVGP
jgi:hypothetical protein